MEIFLSHLFTILPSFNHLFTIIIHYFTSITLLLSIYSFIKSFIAPLSLQHYIQEFAIFYSWLLTQVSWCSCIFKRLAHMGNLLFLFDYSLNFHFLKFIYSWMFPLSLTEMANQRTVQSLSWPQITCYLDLELFCSSFCCCIKNI